MYAIYFVLFWCFVFISSDIGESGMGSAPLSFLGSQPIAMLLVSVYLIILFHLTVDGCLLFFLFLCFYFAVCRIYDISVVLALLVFMPDFVCVFCFLLIAAVSFAGHFLVRSRLSAFPAYYYLRTYSRFDLVWFGLSCDHG